jgi:hypothetical protein
MNCDSADCARNRRKSSIFPVFLGLARELSALLGLEYGALSKGFSTLGILPPHEPFAEGPFCVELSLRR